jgi:hypothetical protein
MLLLPKMHANILRHKHVNMNIISDDLRPRLENFVQREVNWVPDMMRKSTKRRCFVLLWLPSRKR